MYVPYILLEYMKEKSSKFQRWPDICEKKIESYVGKCKYIKLRVATSSLLVSFNTTMENEPKVEDQLIDLLKLYNGEHCQRPHNYDDNGVRERWGTTRRLRLIDLVSRRFRAVLQRT